MYIVFAIFTMVVFFLCARQFIITQIRKLV